MGDWDSVTKNGVLENRSHDAVHQLTQVAAQPLAYDAAGNLTGNSNGQGYAWDVENRLVSASDASGQLGSYAYDAMGRRVSKTAGGVTRLYVSAGPREVAEYVQGQPATSPSRLYAFGDYVDEVLMTAIPNGGGFTRLYHHHDGLYSTRALTDATGALVERYAYDPYGQAWFLDAAGVLLAAQASPSGNAVLFTGRRLDEETGLQYSRARYLNHELGRWIGRDPLEYVDDRSLYSYVRGRATIFLDPSGLTSCYIPTLNCIQRHIKDGNYDIANDLLEDFNTEEQEKIREAIQHLVNFKEIVDALVDAVDIDLPGEPINESGECCKGNCKYRYEVKGTAVQLGVQAAISIGTVYAAGGTSSRCPESGSYTEVELGAQAEARGGVGAAFTGMGGVKIGPSGIESNAKIGLELLGVVLEINKNPEIGDSVAKLEGRLGVGVGAKVGVIKRYSISLKKLDKPCD